MNKLLSTVAFGAMLLASGAAFAADVAAPIVEDVATSAFSGTVEIGGLVRNSAEYDGDDLQYRTTLGGAYAGFALSGNLDQVRIGFDGYVEGVAFDEIADSNSLSPVGLGVFGAHLGTDLDNAYAGVFGAVGLYPDGSNDTIIGGYAAGVEGSVELDQVTLFGKLGYAFAPSEDYEAEDDDYEGFIGPFVEAGLVYALSDDLALLARAGFGTSADFDETDGPGSYVTVGAKLAYRLPTELNLNLVASYDAYRALMDGNDPDETIEHTVKFGLSIPFGAGGTAAEALNPLATSVAPFRAGYSSDAL